MCKTVKVCEQLGPWSIETRTRNNHDGLKIWVLKNGCEVASLDERGWRNRCGNRLSVPHEVELKAQEHWDGLKVAI